MNLEDLRAVLDEMPPPERRRVAVSQVALLVGLAGGAAPDRPLGFDAGGWHLGGIPILRDIQVPAGVAELRRPDGRVERFALVDGVAPGDLVAPAFVCPRCGRASWNPNDGEARYCGACHWPTGDPVLGRVDPPEGGVS